MFNVIQHSRLISSLTLALSCFSLNATESLSWSEGACTAIANEGATKDHYNRAMQLNWNHMFGDWVDANSTNNGTTPYFSINIEDSDTEQTIQSNVTDIVSQWHTQELENHGFLLRYHSGGQTKFLSRENVSDTKQPKLIVETSRKTYTLHANRDTELMPNTSYCSGHNSTLSTKGSVLLGFSLTELPADETIIKATLELTTTTAQYGDVHLKGYATRIDNKVYDFNREDGLAQGYPNDYQLKWDDNVYLVESFDDASWIENWSRVSFLDRLSIVNANELEKFSPLLGNALQIKIPEGELNALNVVYLFEEEIGHDVDEVYFRYYLRLGESWDTNTSGKLPGIAGTYANTSFEGGWGARRSTGENGWSARGVFKTPISDGNELATKVPIGNYIYHSEQKGTYGDVEVWDGQATTAIDRNEWYLIEQYVKLNTPGENDGVLRTWVNGKPAFEHTSYKFRNAGADFIKIDRVWLNIYHGGTTPIHQDSYAFIDNVVIAKQYIGEIEFDDTLPSAGEELNRPPTITRSSPHDSVVTTRFGNQLLFSVKASDEDGDALSYTWSTTEDFSQIIENANTDSYLFKPSLFDNGVVTLFAKVTDTSDNEAVTGWNIHLDTNDITSIPVAADTMLQKNSDYGYGHISPIRVANDRNIYLRFNLASLPSNVALEKAYLVLPVKAQYGASTLEVYAAELNWVEGDRLQAGATKRYFDREYKLYWNNIMGDFIDANGDPNGDVPYVSYFAKKGLNGNNQIILDVTQLLEEQLDSGQVNLTIRSNSQGKIDFIAKENTENLPAASLFIFNK